MTTSNLTAAQQTQMDNRDATGQWKAKTHTGVDNSAAVLGIHEGSGPVLDGMDIDEDLARRNFENALNNRQTKHAPDLRTSARILAASSDEGRATVGEALDAEREHGQQLQEREPRWGRMGDVQAQRIEEGISQADTLEGNLIRWKGEGVGRNAVAMSRQDVADTVEDNSTYQRLDLSRHPSRQHEHHPDEAHQCPRPAPDHDLGGGSDPGNPGCCLGGRPGRMLHRGLHLSAVTAEDSRSA